MNPNVIYLPVVKWKMGEYSAISELHESVRASIAPVIEVPGVPWNFNTDAPAKSLESHLDAVAEQIQEHLEGVPEFFVDGRLLTGDDGVSHLAALLERVNDRRCRPAISVDQPGFEADLQAARELMRQADSEVLLRVSPRKRFGRFAADIAQQLGTERPRCNLMIDCGDIRQDDLDIVGVAASAAFESAVKSGWASLALASTSFPQYLSEVRPPYAELPRLEWLLYRELLGELEGGDPRPIYADYAVTSRNVDELDPRMISVSAAIRYTGDTAFHIFKGQSLRRHSFEQFRTLSNFLTDRAEIYKGSEFSWGDDFIAKCASGEGKVGNNTTWRKVATNHHITLVVSQLREFANQRGA
jgi:hypothetical protein